MRTALAITVLAATLLAACSPSSSSQQPASAAAAPVVKTVAITQIVEHPALDASRKGIEAGLAEAGFKVGDNLKIDYQNAQGSTATAGQIAKKFAADKPDVIVAISTPSAQPVVATVKDVPVVFNAIIDPVAAKLVPSMEAPSGTNVTGMSDYIPFEPQFELMQKLMPNLKRIGYVYSPGEINSTTMLARMQAYLAPKNIEVLAVAAPRTTDVAAAVRSLNGKVDLLYTSFDNGVVSTYESVYKVATEIKLPLVAADTGTVRRGAMAAYGPDFYDLGVQTGHMVARILKGEQPGTIMPEHPKSGHLVVNPTAAAALGFTLPEAVVKEAKEVVGQP
ncbi:ABC transporter substrate-binding protein [Paralysiella testudinis]|uniref:ABC transporter substrate-binding protein n=1 Tax=Paralysiella testudinis TaxID=2809020 RepID=A0A892ZHP2_9NEIS|nr:ABC transporter substrate-binding protein [Paralysiella testudinis]QRQ82153.1 ABC transporter substrate-binding protein [Paralysiella testudinis]